MLVVWCLGNVNGGKKLKQIWPETKLLFWRRHTTKTTKLLSTFEALLLLLLDLQSIVACNQRSNVLPQPRRPVQIVRIDNRVVHTFDPILRSTSKPYVLYLHFRKKIGHSPRVVPIILHAVYWSHSLTRAGWLRVPNQSLVIQMAQPTKATPPITPHLHPNHLDQAHQYPL